MKASGILIVMIFLAGQVLAALYGEAGMGGGAFMVGVGLMRPLNERMGLGAGISYGMGTGYNVAALDIINITYGSFSGGLSYANYSKLVEPTPGVSGALTTKTPVGIGLSFIKNFGDLTGKFGYDTALGLRLSVSRKF